MAAIHADSWRRNYRGAYSDAYLDGDLDAERAAEWTRRLCSGTADALTLVAERDGEVVGFVHLRVDADPTHGALIDNLHVVDRLRGSGIGTRLLAEAGRRLHALRPSGGAYLWVQEQNEAAQGFYRARGGRIADRVAIPPPNGDPANLTGAPFMLRVVWPDAVALT